MNVTGKAKVYNLDTQAKFVKSSLQVGKKKQDETWDNMWFQAKYVGNCKDKASTLQKGDTIDIKSATLESFQSEKKVTYVTIVIFAFDVVKKSDGQQSNEFNPQSEVCKECGLTLDQCGCELPF